MLSFFGESQHFLQIFHIKSFEENALLSVINFFIWHFASYQIYLHVKRVGMTWTTGQWLHGKRPQGIQTKSLR